MQDVLLAVAQRSQHFDESISKGLIKGEGAALLGARFAWMVGKDRLGMANLDAVSQDGAVNDTDKSILFTVTSTNEDRDRDVILPLGIEVANFSKYAPWFLNHQSHGVPIGRSTGPDGKLGWWADENRAKARCWFDPADPQAMFIYEKYKSGFMKAVSISFLPIIAERLSYEEKAHTSPATPQGWLFRRVELTEISLVGLGSNRDALRDSLDADKSFLSPAFQKAFLPFCAAAKGKCFSGWCPCPAVEEAVTKKISKGKSMEPVKSNTAKSPCACTDCKSGKVCGCAKTKAVVAKAIAAKVPGLVAEGYTDEQAHVIAESMVLQAKSAADITGHEQHAEKLCIRKAGGQKRKEYSDVDEVGKYRILFNSSDLQYYVNNEMELTDSRHVAGPFRTEEQAYGWCLNHKSSKTSGGSTPKPKTIGESSGTTGGYTAEGKTMEVDKIDGSDCEDDANSDPECRAMFANVGKDIDGETGVEKELCPDCGGELADGVCACGYKKDEETENIAEQAAAEGMEMELPNEVVNESLGAETESEETEEEQTVPETLEEPVAKNTDPANAPPGAMLHAKMISRHKATMDEMEKDMAKLEPEAREHFGQHLEALKALADAHESAANERYPEHDMKALAGADLGEAGAVAAGEGVAVPVEAAMGDDSAAGEILERYQERPKSGRTGVWKVAKQAIPFGKVAACSGDEIGENPSQWFVVTHPGGDYIDGPMSQSQAVASAKRGGKSAPAPVRKCMKSNDPLHQTMKDASDYMADLAATDEIPARHKGGLKYHSGQLSKAIEGADGVMPPVEPTIPKEVMDDLEKSMLASKAMLGRVNRLGKSVGLNGSVKKASTSR